MFKKIYSYILDRPYAVGTVLLCRYRIINVLGIGSYGISYLCDDMKEGRKCVVKQVKPSIRKTAKGKKAYAYETEILSKLDSRFFPKLYHTFVERDQLFFAMEYVSGPNLEEYLFDSGKKYSEIKAISTLIEIIDIVEYLHARDIIHRDIRLPNLIVEENRIRLIDFGLARFIGEDNSDEQLDKAPLEKKLRRETHVSSDLYALGHLLLFLLYTTYEPTEEERSWEEELSLKPLTKSVLERLLHIKEPYANISELKKDLMLIQ